MSTASRKIFSSKLRSLFSVSVVAALFSACSDDALNGRTCDAMAIVGVNVDVPGGSAMLRLGKTINATLTDGSYTEQMQLWSADPSGQDPVRLAGAMERPGSYSLTVRVPGYQDFRKDNLTVTRDGSGCHVTPIRVTATLTPTITRQLARIDS
ncbi:MAG: hypothetical protein ABI852_12405 [Gemmatimonadaceae bacterium]